MIDKDLHEKLALVMRVQLRVHVQDILKGLLMQVIVCHDISDKHKSCWRSVVIGSCGLMVLDCRKRVKQRMKAIVHLDLSVLVSAKL